MSNEHPISVEEHLDAARRMCLDSLSSPSFERFAAYLPDAPKDAQGWFDLLHAYDLANVAITRSFADMKGRLPAANGSGGVTLEQYAALQAFVVALPCVGALPVSRSVKRRFAIASIEIASSNPLWREHLVNGRSRFVELAELASLRRCPAGELDFLYRPVLSKSAPLRIQPSAFPGFVRKIVLEMKGIGPTISLHVNYARKNQLILCQEDTIKTIWRAVKSVECDNSIIGMSGYSWLFSSITGELFPNLAWFRGVFEGAGGYLVDLGPAPETGGFRGNSARRQKLYDEGKFHPRHTMLMWSREDMLAWAASRPDLVDSDDEPVAAPRRRRRSRVKSPPSARAGKHNSPITLWDGQALLDSRPERYVLLTMMAPAVVVGGVAGLAAGGWAVVPGGALAFAAAWIFQYYFFQ